MIKKKSRIGILLFATLVCMAFIPAVSAATENDKSDIIIVLRFRSRFIKLNFWIDPKITDLSREIKNWFWNRSTSIEFNKESFSTYNVTLDYFETVTTNPTIFLNDVSDGQVTLKLLGQKFDLDLHEVKIVSDDAKIIAEDGSISDAPKAYSYQGVVVGKPNSSVALTVGDDVLIGEIKIGNKIYTIDQTSKKYNNKVVHLVYSSDAMKKR